MFFTKVMSQPGIHRHMRDLAICSSKVDSVIVVLNASTDDVLVHTDSPMVMKNIENHLRKYFHITTKQGKVLTASHNHIHM